MEYKGVDIKFQRELKNKKVLFVDILAQNLVGSN